MSQIIKLSDNAATRIKEIMSSAQRNSIGVRVSVKSGGCAGMSYVLEYSKKINSNDEITKSYFQSTKDKLLIVLNNSGIESFTPELNIQSLDHQGCEVDINTEPTTDKNKNNLIHSVVANGFKLTLKDSDTHYIKKALVKVYEFKNTEIVNEK